MSSSPRRVLLVEDSELLAEHLKELIDKIPGVQLVATVDQERDAVELLETAAVDALVLDLQLRTGTGFGVLRKMAAMSHHPMVVVYTNYDLPEYRRQAARLGVTHFLDKSSDYDRLEEILGDLGRASA